MKKLLSLLTIFLIVLSCSSDETSTPVTPPPAPIAKYTISFSAGEGGTVSTTGGEYEEGQTVSVTATPQGEYLFTGWSDGSTDATRTITVDATKTLTANFEKKKYPLTVNTEGQGEVTEEIVSAGRTTDYDSGTTVKLTAVPAEGWEFVGWEGALNGNSNPQQLLVNETKNITAIFINSGYLSFDLDKKLIPIPDNIDFNHTYFTNTGRNTYVDLNKFRKLVYLKRYDSNQIVDSLLYNPNIDKTLLIPLPKDQGTYYYEEVTFYNGFTTSPNIIEWQETNLSSSNRLEYKIFSEPFLFPSENPNLQIKYQHDAVIFTKQAGVNSISVGHDGYTPGGKYVYVNSIIEKYPTRIVFDDYSIIKSPQNVTKNGFTEIIINGDEKRIPFSIPHITNDDDYYTVNDQLTQAFSKLREDSATHGGYFSVQSISSDEMAITQKGGDWYEGGIWLDIHKHEQKASNSAIRTTWSNQYNAISEVNNAIRNGNLTSNLLAQAKVLRAYLHWRLLDMYGRIRFVDEFGQSGQLTRLEGFNKIENELLSALGIDSIAQSITLNTSLNTNDEKYRINQFAALGILAKLYLNAEIYTGTSRWQEAFNASNYIIENSSYRLSDFSVEVPNPNKRPEVVSDPDKINGYAALFSPFNYDNPEIIWSIQYNSTNSTGMNFHMLTLNYASQQRYLLSEQPWNGYVALEDFYNSYEPSDKRRESNFIVGEQTDFVGNPLYSYSNITNYGTLNYNKKLNQLSPNASRTDGARLGKFAFKNGAGPNGQSDFPIIRLGEIYLTRAEASARLNGDWNRALSDVNIIRARAGLNSIGGITDRAFLKERGREMFMEGSRRTDLIRFGYFNTLWWQKSNTENYKNLMPIPIDIIVNGNGSLTQNPGY